MRPPAHSLATAERDACCSVLRLVSEHGQIDRTRKLLGRFDRCEGFERPKAGIEGCSARTFASARKDIGQSCHGHQSAV